MPAIPDRRLRLDEGERRRGLARSGIYRYPSKISQGRRPARNSWPGIAGIPSHAGSTRLFEIDDPDRWGCEVNGPVPNRPVGKDSQPTTYHVAIALENPVARHDAANPKSQPTQESAVGSFAVARMRAR